MRRFIRPLIVVGFVLGALLPSAWATADLAPSWQLQTPDGQTVRFPEDAKHQPTVLLFWPSWCPYSRALQPYVQDIWKDYRDAGVHVWTINIKETGDPLQAMKDRGLSFPVLLKGDALIESYGIVRTPWLVVIDGNDRIVYTRPASSPSPIEVAKKVRETLNGLLGARAVPLPTSYPPPYDLHLRKATAGTAPDAEWQPWAKQYLEGIAADEKLADIAPLGPIKDGRAAIDAARTLWTQRYGTEQVTIQAPFRAYRWNTRWVVSGLASAGHLGEGFVLAIDATNGQVLRIGPGSLPH